MKISKRVKRMERQYKFGGRAVHLNIVSMIDVFAVLVFFLLVSSSLAAAKLNVISLNLPSKDLQPDPENLPLQLTATVRQDVIEVSDGRGPIRNIGNTPDGYNLTALADLLVEVKRSKPSEQNLTLMVESEVVYDDVVNIIDTVRLTPAEARSEGLPREMFPQISMGEARKLESGAAPAEGAAATQP